MKFSIRDLLLVTVIVAVCVAWWLDRTRLAKQLETERLIHLLLPDSSGPAPNPSKD